MMQETKTDTGLIKLYKKCQSLLEAVDAIVWEADARNYEFSFISDSAIHILGYTPEEWLRNPNFWESHIYHEDREQAISYYQQQAQLAQGYAFDYRVIKADGSIIWMKNIVSVISEDGYPRWLRGIMVDITETKLLADLEHLEKQVLALNSEKEIDIETVLDFYVHGIERLFPQMKCSVLRVGDNKLHRWSSPSLQEGYVTLIDNLGIGPENGSCGTAAYLNERVIVSDIANDVKWAKYKQFALPYNLRACWSYPITNSDNRVVAVFGMYYGTIKIPNENELAIVERSAAILKIIIENRTYAHMMREINVLASQGQALANFGTWQWDIVSNKVTWSDVLYKIYGRNEQSFVATFEGYQNMLHPDDRERVKQTIYGVLETHKDATFEERIVRPAGDVRYLKSWGRVVLSEAGKPVKMIGACLDITQAKTTEIKMKEIAWMQSHVIRAPLARLMGLVNILQETIAPDEESTGLLNGISETANELDFVIRNISDNTKV